MKFVLNGIFIIDAEICVPITLYYRYGFFDNSGNSIYVPLRNVSTPTNTTICIHTLDNQLIKKLRNANINIKLLKVSQAIKA